MKITLLVVGKSNNDHLQKLELLYRERLKHYASFDITVIPELKNTKSITESEQKEREADLILKALPIPMKLFYSTKTDHSLVPLLFQVLSKKE